MPQSASYTRVKVFGERGSGTNFLSRAIHANFTVEMLVHADPRKHPDVQPLIGVKAAERRKGEIGERIEDYLHELTLHDRGGWKHACLTDRLFDVLEHLEETLIICTVRHPALWLESLHRSPFSGFLQEDMDFDTFLATPWITRPRDELPDLMLESPVLLWRRKTESYLRYAQSRPNVKIVRHEDLLKNFSGVMDLFEPFLERRRKTWGIPKNYGRSWGDETRDYWTIREELPEDPYSVLTPDQAAHVRAQIGSKLLERFGYA